MSSARIWVEDLGTIFLHGQVHSFHAAEVDLKVVEAATSYNVQTGVLHECIRLAEHEALRGKFVGFSIGIIAEPNTRLHRLNSIPYSIDDHWTLRIVLSVICHDN